MSLFTRGTRFNWGAGIFESRYSPFYYDSLFKKSQGLVTVKYLGSLQMKTRIF